MAANEMIRYLFTIIILFSSPFFVYSASIAVADDSCPVIHPNCVCSGETFYTINCKNISDFDVIYDILGNFTEKTFTFEIGSLNLPAFPEQAFDNPFLTSLIITNSAFRVLFNSSALTATNKSSIVHFISLENVTTSNSWNWDQLDVFRKLDIFFLYNTTVGDNLPADFSQHVSKSLKFLSISQTNVSMVEPESLQELTNLSYFRVSHSKLSTLTRDILPSPSKLGQLRLDHNMIASLPDDMFESMPNLTIVTLSNNRISLLSEELFRPVWRPEVHLELRNNPIKCDCRMRWLVTSINKPNIIGECRHPKKLHGKEISTLTIEDLNC